MLRREKSPFYVKKTARRHVRARGHRQSQARGGLPWLFRKRTLAPHGSVLRLECGRDHRHLSLSTPPYPTRRTMIAASVSITHPSQEQATLSICMLMLSGLRTGTNGFRQGGSGRRGHGRGHFNRQARVQRRGTLELHQGKSPTHSIEREVHLLTVLRRVASDLSAAGCQG